MTDQQGPVLSVRGYAHQTVAPDCARIFGGLETVSDSKAAALSEAGRAIGLITADLAVLGGVAQDADTVRRPLTWSVRAVATHKEQEHNLERQRMEATGRVIAHASIQLAVRDFDLLDSLADRLAAHEPFNIHGVSWEVDEDNPAWPRVREAAIQAAIRQGRDYARALGAALASIDHVADAGLLGNAPTPASSAGWATMSAARMSGDPSGGPSLDPVPQELSATIEARFTTTPVTLPTD